MEIDVLPAASRAHQNLTPSTSTPSSLAQGSLCPGLRAGHSVQQGSTFTVPRPRWSSLKFLSLEKLSSLPIPSLDEGTDPQLLFTVVWFGDTRPGTWGLTQVGYVCSFLLVYTSISPWMRAA